MNLVLVVIFSYLIGSIPFSLLIAKARGVNLASSGTKNLGGSNVALTSGIKFGIIAIILDILKGFIPVILTRVLIGTDLAVVSVGLAAVLGHDFSLYLKFKGGKGLATTGGAFIAINPYLVLVCIIVYWSLYFFIKKYIPTTLLLLTLVPILVWFFNLGNLYIILSICFALLAYWTHRLDVAKILSPKSETLNKS